MVGVRGFEPLTSASRTLRATELRHTPMLTTVGLILGCSPFLLNELCALVLLGDQDVRGL